MVVSQLLKLYAVVWRANRGRGTEMDMEGSNSDRDVDNLSPDGNNHERSIPNSLNYLYMLVYVRK
jgi:hypothetical protein